MRQWHIVGDSHIGAFRRAHETGLIGRPCLFTEVHGATAVGLRNPNSQTDAIGIFKTTLLPVHPDVTPVIQLGEVDCGFVIWHRAQKYGESIEVQLDQSLQAYFEFVDQLLAAGYPTVVVTGATLPTIRDGQDWGDVANARRDIQASLKRRTELTLTYNARLRKMAQRRGLAFVDISRQVLERRTGVLADHYRHPDPRDHHLDPDKAGPLWARALNRAEHWRGRTRLARFIETKVSALVEMWRAA